MSSSGCPSQSVTGRDSRSPATISNSTARVLRAADSTLRWYRRKHLMCMAHERHCSCGERSVSFHFKDNIMPEQVIRDLYCPSCAKGVAIDQSTMVTDN